MIRRSDQELYHLTLLTSGVHGLRRGRDQAETFGVGDFALIDSSTPHDVRMFGDRAPGAGGPDVAGVGIDLPVSLLPVPPHQLRDLLGRRLSGRGAQGRCWRSSSSAWTARPPSSSPPRRPASARSWST
ncbi:hypothetical protein ACFXDE_25735 [Kitasatospora sp. NPDC059408]|uniref:hypothetical protein n=1 Tax=Kitasatospora sp. NPDC059408 TaxID=3346823 RepID=UPI0036798ED2